LRLEIDVSRGKVIGGADDIGDAPILIDCPWRREAALGHESDYTPCRPRLRQRNSRREASPYDAAVQQLILNGIGHIGMRRGNSILKAAMLGRIQFERELVAHFGMIQRRVPRDVTNIISN